MKCDELKIKHDYRSGEPYYQIRDVDDAIAELKAKLETVQATAYTESVDAGMRERSLMRALWLARHERACAVAQWHLTLSEYDEANKWDKVVQKTLAKAKEYE